MAKLLLRNISIGTFVSVLMVFCAPPLPLAFHFVGKAWVERRKQNGRHLGKAVDEFDFSVPRLIYRKRYSIWFRRSKVCPPNLFVAS